MVTRSITPQVDFELDLIKCQTTTIVPPVADRRRPRTLAERALEDLQEAILRGDLEPGSPLRLEKLARALEMSPMPVREAVRQLEALGLAEHVPHRGARVSRLSTEDLRDTYEARLALETLAVRQAAERFTGEDAEVATRRIEEHAAAYRADDFRRGREAHAAFHFGLYEASGSRWLPRLIRPLWENSERYRIASLHVHGSFERRRREHQRIVEACASNAPDDAAAALRTHLVVTANLVARWMGEHDLFAE
jgi:DNA-binding GntR family transcriptional regulator